MSGLFDSLLEVEEIKLTQMYTKYFKVTSYSKIIMRHCQKIVIQLVWNYTAFKKFHSLVGYFWNQEGRMGDEEVILKQFDLLSLRKTKVLTMWLAFMWTKQDLETLLLRIKLHAKFHARWNASSLIWVLPHFSLKTRYQAPATGLNSLLCRDTEKHESYFPESESTS